MAGQKSHSTSDTKNRLSTSIDSSPTIEELKKNIYVILEMYKGYTEAEALRNYECEHGTCQCP